MQELLLVNPSHRPKKRAKGRSAAQKAATRKLVAFNRGRKSNPGPKRKRRVKARRAGRKSVTVAVRSNPSPRRRARRSNPIKHRRARRRNPIGVSIMKPMGILKPALMGALGATAVNSVLAQVGGYLPASLMTGNVAIATRAVAAFGLAMIAGKLGMRGAMISQMAEGSLTVTLHDAITSIAAQAGISQLSGMKMYMPGVQAGAAPRLAGMRAYASGPGSMHALKPASQSMSGFGMGF